MSATGKRVVVMGVDDSNQAVDAFKWYSAQIRKPNDFLVLVHTPEIIVPMTMSPATVDKLLREEIQQVKQLEDKYEAMMKQSGMEGKFRTGKGKPGEVVVQVANEEGASMVVTGTRGMGLIRRTVMGSVSDYITHHCHVPVLVCRQKQN